MQVVLKLSKIERTFANNNVFSSAQPLPVEVVSPMSSSSKPLSRGERSSARLSAKDLLEQRMRSKALPKGCPSKLLPPKSSGHKRKFVRVSDDVSRGKSMKRGIDFPELLTLPVPDDIKDLPSLENLEMAATSSWTVFQHLKSSHLKTKQMWDDAQSKISQAEGRAKEADALLKASEGARRVIETNLKAFEQRISELEARLENAKKEGGEVATDVGAYFTLKSRIEMMEDLKAGHHESWDLEKEQAYLDEQFPSGCHDVDFLQACGTVGVVAEERAEVSSRRTRMASDPAPDATQGKDVEV